MSKQLEAINLEAFTDSELTQLEKSIQRERKRREKTRVEDAHKEIRLVAAKYGLKLEDVVGNGSGKKGPAGGGSRIAPKFRHPEDPGKTWSGRGRPPRWVQEWEQHGGSREELRIN